MIYATALLLAELTQFCLHWGTHTYIKSRLQWDWSGQQFAMQRCAVPMVNGGVRVPSRRLGTLAVNWPWWFGFSGLSCSMSYLYMFFYICHYIFIEWYIYIVIYCVCLFYQNDISIKYLEPLWPLFLGFNPASKRKLKFPMKTVISRFQVHLGCPSWTNQHDSIEVTIRWYDWVVQFGPKIFQN